MADEEQTTPENDPGVEETAQAESAQTEPEQVETAPQPQQSAVSHEHRNQWIFFGILAGILIGVVLAIAVLRPLIFDRIVPAVMGDFATSVPGSVEEAAPVEDQPASGEIAPVDNTSDSETTESNDNQVFIPAAASGDGTGAAAPSEAPANVPPEEASPESVTHTVQVGDNLTKISQQYGVPVAEIMAANNLTNADYISVGQILVIPTN